jgi:hypothetical protein
MQQQEQVGWFTGIGSLIAVLLVSGAYWPSQVAWIIVVLIPVVVIGLLIVFIRWASGSGGKSTTHTE